MSVPITSIAPIAVPGFGAASTAIPSALGPASSSGGFGDLFHSALQRVSQSAATADTAVSNYLNGGNGELHSAILAVQKADLDFELALQVRNKVVSAYEEVMKMQI